VVDIEGYTRRDYDAQAGLQERLLKAVELGVALARIEPAACARQDRGDGLLILLPPEADRDLCAEELLRGLADALACVNSAPDSAWRGGHIRLRAALTRGLAHRAATGYVGDAVVEACRLLESQAVRSALSSAPDRDLAVIVGNDAYVGALRAADFRPVSVSIPDKAFTADAWVGVLRPGDPERQLASLDRIPQGAPVPGAA
jgi:hypothetical protein